MTAPMTSGVLPRLLSVDTSARGLGPQELEVKLVPGIVLRGKVTDAETGAEFDIDVDEDLLVRYRQRFEKRLREVRAYLRAKQVPHLLIDTAHAGEAELLRQLLRERVLR